LGKGSYRGARGLRRHPVIVSGASRILYFKRAGSRGPNIENAQIGRGGIEPMGCFFARFVSPR